MVLLYYLGNLIVTCLTLLPALGGLFYHLPLSKKLINANLIKNEKELIKINQKRVIIFLAAYALFIILSLYFFGIGSLISTAINLVLCIATEIKKIRGRDISMQESFLSANNKYFKDPKKVKMFVNDKITQ